MKLNLTMYFNSDDGYIQYVEESIYEHKDVEGLTRVPITRERYNELFDDMDFSKTYRLDQETGDILLVDYPVKK